MVDIRPDIRPVRSRSAQSPRAKSKATESIASLDGIRALAIALVFLAHGGLSEIVPGGLGVTLFFVLSGFLITTLMLKEIETTGALDRGAFYLRRLCRLMPPLLIILVLTLVLSALFRPHASPTVPGVAAVIFYFSNYFAIFGNSGIPDGLGVTWSLAVEEHFYIVFPLIAPFLIRHGRGIRAACLGIVCLLILGWRCWLTAHGAEGGRIYGATDTRLDSILIGCAMALLCNPVLDPVHAPSPRQTFAVSIAALSVIVATLSYRNEFFRDTYRFTVQSFAITPLIFLAITQSQHFLFRWLNAGPIVYLGRISYTVYLAHQVCIVIVSDQWPTLGLIWTMALAALLTLAIAVPMRLWVELPFARVRKRLHQWQNTVVLPVAPAAM